MAESDNDSSPELTHANGAGEDNHQQSDTPTTDTHTTLPTLKADKKVWKPASSDESLPKGNKDQAQEQSLAEEDTEAETAEGRQASANNTETTSAQASTLNGGEETKESFSSVSAELHDGAPQRKDSAATQSRNRSDSRSTVATFMTSRTTPISSTVFVVTALETIAASKDAKKNKELEDATQKALLNIKQTDNQPIDPEVIFRPLQLASRTYSIPLQVTALDCIGKLISYSYFAFPTSSPKTTTAEDGSTVEELPLIERAIETICECFENEATPPEIQQQIIKSLLAAVLNDKIVVHGAGLLKAVRQIYNIFIYSKSSQNQQIAQGSLTQMAGTVFDRVRTRLDMKEARSRPTNEEKSEEDLGGEQLEMNGSGDADETPDPTSVETPDEPATKGGENKLTLKDFENTKNLDDAVVTDNAPTMVTRARASRAASTAQSSSHGEGETDHSREEEEDEIYIKDAFLVFRSLCKLSHKVLTHDQQQDIKSQNMRSKLLSLHLIHNLLNNHVSVFTSPLATIKSSSSGASTTSLMQASKPHLCLSLSRNGSSSVPRVFEVCTAIFWLMMKDLRVVLKKELEVFMKEIYLAILERRTAPMFQKQYFLDILEQLATEPRALVELYLNYDCDRTALDNMFQNIIENLSRISSTPVTTSPIQQQQYYEQHIRSSRTNTDWQQKGTLPPYLSTATIAQHPPLNPAVPQDYVLKQHAFECLIEILKSLDNWSSHSMDASHNPSTDNVSRVSTDEPRDSLDANGTPSLLQTRNASGDAITAPSTPLPEDDPQAIEKQKMRKTALDHGIRQFNFKPKRGIKVLLKDGFIRSESPQDIATFLLRTDRLDKAMIGEYLGEGDPENVAIMHAFVDSMDFAKRRFVDALRQFLQSFRLPGEAQKIDRFMLKFAERYLTGNPNAFANADTAYVLAYSVIMLNTDQHSAKLKGPRMTKEDFIKNNRGINDSQDLPDEYLVGIFDEISQHEIVLNTEREHAAALGINTQAPAAGLAARAGQVLATVGRDIQGEKYAQASEEMANKTEQLYRSLIRAQRKTATREPISRFIPATSVKHVGPMFNVTWMSFLSGLSGQLQDSHNAENVRQCMEGLRTAIRIACVFDLDTPRLAFVTVLSKFTNLGNLREMQSKNMEALKVLLEVAIEDGNMLGSAWREILTCISQLDRFQLLTDGVDEGSLPDMSKAHLPAPSNTGNRKSMQTRRPRPRSMVSGFRQDIAMESRSAEVIRSVDRIFTNTAKLSSSAIIDFVRALSEVSWQEIESTGHTESPRTYSLQKLVEISYYNMTRVRIEWSKIWEALGGYFNKVGCHPNTAVVFFALDSLRQLSMRFMDLEELAGFKFQKDFLKPFEHVMANSNVVTVKDMVLRCLIQMIQARGDRIKSGWKTMFGVFTVAAKEPYEGIVGMALEHVMQVYTTRFGVVISQGAFADLIVCLTEFSKNARFQKKSLQAIETLKSTVPKMLKTPECPLSRKRGADVAENGAMTVSKQNPQTPEEQFWYPVLIAFQDVLMTGDDLEVRSRALSYLFETLIRYGGDFPSEFWDVLWRQILYPIFVVLHSKSEMSKVPNHEELSVWLSTTMIQALRSMITLFTHYFEALEHMLDRFLNLLTLCICQENDTIARIGSNCLQQLILENVNKFQDNHWTQIVGAFVELFHKTTARELFSAATTNVSRERATSRGESINEEAGEAPAANGEAASTTTIQINGEPSPLTEEPPAPAPAAPASLEEFRPPSEMNSQPVVVTAARRHFFNRIITNCVLQLLMIETVNELFSNDAVYAQIPSPELLRLMALLKSSYQFAKKFNEDKDLRMALWRQGFMKQPPNLLKQESGSAATYVSILLRMYHDEGEERKRSRDETEEALIPLCADIIRSYNMLDPDTQHRNILAWRPVVVDVLEGYLNFPSDSFDKHIETFYPLSIELLGAREMGTEVRFVLQAVLRRVGETRFGGMPTSSMWLSPSSPRTGSFGNVFGGAAMGGRRLSRSSTKG